MSDTDADVGSSSAQTADYEHPGPPRGSAVYDADTQAMIEAIERATHPDPDGLELKDRGDHMLPQLRLPGFGEPEENCGEFIPEAMRFCQHCGDPYEFKHNCLRYDCPDHAAHAIRRRAAGSDDGAGIAPALKALQSYLYAYRSDDHYFHHLVFSPGEDWFTESKYPLERTKQVIRELLDELGLQGLVAYHPFRGEHEEEGEDDMGEWRKRLFHDREWTGDVREDLSAEGHFHAVVVGPWVDLADVEQVHDETGWVIHRILKENSNVSIEDEKDMAEVVTYALSHAGVMDTPEQRRLAAWMKGPDVHRISPTESIKAFMSPIVAEAAEDTLGIASPSLECENEHPPAVHLGPTDQLEPFERPSQNQPPNPFGLSDPEAAEGFSSPSGPGGLPGTVGGRHVEAVGGLSNPNSGALPERDDDLGAPGTSGPAGSGGSSSSSSTAASSGGSDVSGADERELEACGGHLRHISKAGEYLLDGEWRRTARHVDDLETAYRSYVDYMTRADRDPTEDRTMLAEERHEPDAPPDD